MKTAAEFFEFFSNIPEDNWLRKQYISQENPNCRCASGHLRRFVLEKNKWIFENALPNDDVLQINKILKEYYGRDGLLLRINDGTHPLFGKDFSPKAAVQSALYAIMVNFDSAILFKNENSGEFCVQLSNKNNVKAVLASFPENEEAAAKQYLEKWNLLFLKKFNKLYFVEKDLTDE